MSPPPPTSTLFPYTTLFRSDGFAQSVGGNAAERILPPVLQHELDRVGQVLDALLLRPPLAVGTGNLGAVRDEPLDRKSTRLNSSHQIISYAVFCLKKKKNTH